MTHVSHPLITVFIGHSNQLNLEYISQFLKMSDNLKTFCILIILLISVSIDCENQRQNWCSLINPNGVYKGLGIYRRYNSWDYQSNELVMFNRAGAEWLFDVTFDQKKQTFNIIMRDNSVKKIDDKGVVHRFGIFDYVWSERLWDCRVQTSVKHFE